MTRGIDVSTYQGTIDWRAVARSGIRFAYAKATEGAHYRDESFQDYHDGAKRAGIAFGPYHFFRFGTDPIAQAQHFLATIDGYEGQLLPMVDVEAGGQDGITDLDALVGSLAAFLRTVEKTLDGKRCIIYSDYGDWNGFMQGTDDFSGHPFWVAEYNSDAAPTLPGGFSSWVIWQHTDSLSVDGIDGPVDGDYLNGSNLGVIAR